MKSAMRFEKAACRLCLLGNRAKLERVRIYAAGELLLDLQRRDAYFPIDLEDVKFDQAVDILTVFDLAGNEIEQAQALPQEIVQAQSSAAAPKGNKRRGRQHGMAITPLQGG